MNNESGGSFFFLTFIYFVVKYFYICVSHITFLVTYVGYI